jgi:hypothetical protein
VTHPQFTPKPADSQNTGKAPEESDAGAGKAIDQTWDRLHQKPGGAMDDPTDGPRRTEREPLPHRRDIPGQEVPEQDPDLEPTIGDDEDENQDTAPIDEQKGGRSIPL